MIKEISMGQDELKEYVVFVNYMSKIRSKSRLWVADFNEWNLVDEYLWMLWKLGLIYVDE